MDYRHLGPSALKVSPLCLGAMMFGDATDEPTSARIIDKARDQGINFIDTADGYAAGRSGEYVGRAIKAHRHHWVPAHYISARPGDVYAPPSWHHRGGRWVMEPSRWNRGPAHHYGPPPGHYRDHGDRHHRKHDKHDRHHGRDRDRDGIRDRHDRDRDGDGVRNRHDRRPDNPYRY